MHITGLTLELVYIFFREGDSVDYYERIALQSPQRCQLREKKIRVQFLRKKREITRISW